MNELFLTNYSKISFLNKIKESLSKCNSFMFSVSFIKKAGLVMLEREIEEALDRGVSGRIITSTYQNFTDVMSLETFNSWKIKYKNFDCHLDFGSFGDNGFHSKGYIFEYDNNIEIIVGSSNITRYALLKNIEWNTSVITNKEDKYKLDVYGEYGYLWNNTLEISPQIIKEYRLLLDYAIEKWDMDYVNPNEDIVKPNYMQRRALKELRRYRDVGVKRALIISATGSGKTYLAAFDARNFDAKRVLYVVHRDSILNDAKNTFMKVFGAEKSYGMYTGKAKDLECDFIFASSNMLSRHIDEFDAKEFDYICYDEVHHIVADCGQKIFKHFNPEFLLGLTATPERMDNKDVYGLFDENVPFELRLRDAITNDLVVPFHYYGIRTKLADYSSQDRMKVAKEISRVENVEFISGEIEKYRKENEKLKAIAFCSNIAHCKLMAEELEEQGYNTVALTGANDLGQRIKAFKDLQDETNPLEIICAVDILNEGVDIPAINMVLFLRPTESSTIFLQQLGRGLRKYENKEYVTVLDFIGNNYSRSVQIALALGTLGKTTYTEKSYLKELVRTNFESLSIPGVQINIDELSKEEIVAYLEKENFNSSRFLKKDYENFKKYLQTETYPSHMDYLDSEIAPNILRFLKSKIGGKKNKSYYKFLKNIEEESIPLFNDKEIEVIDKIEDMLPLVREDEYLILKYILENNKVDLEEIEKYSKRVTRESLKIAIDNLSKQEIILSNKINLDQLSDDMKDYLEDTLNYGINRFDYEFGDFEGEYKLYGNYYKEQVPLLLNKPIMSMQLKGTYFFDDVTYVFVGLKKDKSKEERTNYKDKFISSKIFQWESENNTTFENRVGKAIQNTKKIHLFIRKMDDEDGITLPFTYFGTGHYENIRASQVVNKSNGEVYPTLMTDIVLDNEVPEEYYLDFNIPEDNNQN